MEGTVGRGPGELALIARAAEGNHAAFHALVVSYEPRLLAKAGRAAT